REGGARLQPLATICHCLHNSWLRKCSACRDGACRSWASADSAVSGECGSLPHCPYSPGAGCERVGLDYLPHTRMQASDTENLGPRIWVRDGFSHVGPTHRTRACYSYHIRRVLGRRRDCSGSGRSVLRCLAHDYVLVWAGAAAVDRSNASERQPGANQAAGGNVRKPPIVSPLSRIRTNVVCCNRDAL